MYDLRNDSVRVRQIQEATLTRPDVGLLPEPALFGSADWWAAVEDGRVPTRTVEGRVSEVRWESMGDWPGWTFTAVDGEASNWTREGDYTRYVEGLAARLTIAVVSWKPDSQMVRLGRPAEHEMLIRVELEPSDLRSERDVPGPFGLVPSPEEGPMRPSRRPRWWRGRRGR